MGLKTQDVKGLSETASPLAEHSLQLDWKIMSEPIEEVKTGLKAQLMTDSRVNMETSLSWVEPVLTKQLESFAV